MYASKTDLIRRFGEYEITELTSKDGVGIDDLQVEEALADAFGEINARLQSRFVLPLIGTSGMLKIAMCDIARYRLAENNVTEEILRRYEYAMKWLDDVVRGKSGLGEGVTDSSPDTPEIANQQLSTFSYRNLRKCRPNCH